MSKIPPKNEPPVFDNTPGVDTTSTPTTQTPPTSPGHADQSSFESKAISPGADAPSPLDAAFSESVSSDATEVNEDLIPDPPEEFFDALETLQQIQQRDQADAIPEPPEEFFLAAQTLDTEFFTFGDARMSRADIKQTIKIVQDMETVLIHALQRQLKQQDIPGGAPRKTRAARVRKTVPGPDGKPRTLTLRARKDSVESVKERYFSKRERTALQRLAEALPKITNTNDFNTKMGGFQREALQALSVPPVEIYQIRNLLPIQETGSLLPSEPGGKQKPKPTLTRVTSPMLTDKARQAGVFED